MTTLFRLKGFSPFVLIVFLNAFVDLGHKILIQNTLFKVQEGQELIILTAVVNGLILLPFILLFSASGFLSDRFRKPRVMQYSAAAAVGLTLFITIFYYLGWFQAAFAMTFLLAVQSAIYSPAKFGYIKELVGKGALATANGVIQAVSIVAILSGIFLFSIIFEQRLVGVDYADESELLQAVAPAGWLLVTCSLAELVFAMTLPHRDAGAPSRRFHWGRYLRGQYLLLNIRQISASRTIWLSIVGLSVFWGISQVVLAAFPSLAKETLGETNTVVIQGTMACFGIGVIIGSLLAGRASTRHIETGLVPLGALGVVIMLSLVPQISDWRLLAFCFSMLGVFGGIFIVPLNALIQFNAPASGLGSVLAGKNWVQNLVMTAFLGLTVLFVLKGLDSTGLFYLLTLVALAGAFYTIYQLPQSLVRYVFGRIFSSTYRIEIIGFENMPGQGGVLMLGNHISWLDWAMVQIASPRPVHFVMHRAIYRLWYLKWFLDLFGVIPIARGHSKEALQEINRLLREGEVVCLFPEGTISRNGQLGEFKKGYERCVNGVEGVILPFYLRGLWGSRFSRSSEKHREQRSTRLRRGVIIAFGPPLPLQTRVHELKGRIFDLSIDAWEQHTQSLDPVPLSWLRTARRLGRRPCIADSDGAAGLSGFGMLAMVLRLSIWMRRVSQEQRVAVMLPNSVSALAANLALLLSGKTVVNLDYTIGAEALQATLQRAGIRSVYSSHEFLTSLDSAGTQSALLPPDIQIHDLTNRELNAGRLERILFAAVAILVPAKILHLFFGRHTDIEDPATVVFTYGVGAEPRGVVLSHRNIMANIQQVSDVLDTRDQDVFMSTLPLYQAYGLTVTGLAPLIEGIPAVCHSNAGDTLTVAKTIYEHQATVYCGTPSLLDKFIGNNRVHSLMLESLRIVVAGAGGLNPKVREGFKLKFNKEIYEGYGSTETTPVASVNIPDRLDPDDWSIQPGNRPGTLGMPLPGSSFRIVNPATLVSLPIGIEGLILCGGTQVMLGYLDEPEATAAAIIELEGKRWFNTGDKGYLDEDGFLTVTGSYSTKS